MAIRYDKKFRAEIRSTISKYNRKVRRLKGRTDVYVPSTVDKEMINEMKRKSGTRQDLRRQLKVLERFSERGGEKYVTSNGVKAPKYLVKSAQTLTRSLSRKINDEIKALKTTKPKVLGVEQDVTFAQMADRRYLNLTAKQLNIKTGQELKALDSEGLQTYVKFLTGNLKTTDVKRWKDSYLEMLIDSAYTYGIPHSVVHSLHEKLKKLTPQQFDELFSTDKSLQSIVFYYNAIEDVGIDQAYESMKDDVQGLFESLLENIDSMLSG